MDINSFFRGLSDVFASGQRDQVQPYLESGLRSAEDEEDWHAVVSILNEMIGYFRSVSKYPEAISTAERAIREMRELGYEGSEAYGTTLLNAATAYRAAGDQNTALALFAETLRIFKDKVPEDDPRLAGLYNNISACHEDAGESDKAGQALQQALDILLRHGDAPLDTATVYTNLALNLFSRNKNAEAMDALQNALNLFEANRDHEKSRHDPHYAAALAALAGAHYKMDQPGEAAAIYETVLAHIDAFYGKNRDFAITSRNCALAYEALGETAKALEHREKADAVFAGLGLR